ncbi:hypothetical protein CPAR01_10116 [Colletotrichum paranaense]|nr:uncharacterized protein CPAR01_10116 [Colletotrichum paranaense]KAK1533408.1 hypothetical protein CPAR01_10116 [Colletotrichum paranaense]
MGHGDWTGEIEPRKKARRRRGIRGTYLTPWAAVAQVSTPIVENPVAGTYPCTPILPRAARTLSVLVPSSPRSEYLPSTCVRVAFHPLSHTALHKASSINYAGRYGQQPDTASLLFRCQLADSYAGSSNQTGLWPQPASGQHPELPYFRACRRCHALVASAHITSPLTSPQIKKYRHRKRAKYDITKAQLYPNPLYQGIPAYRHQAT